MAVVPAHLVAAHDLQDGGHRLGAVAVVGVSPRLLLLHPVEVRRAVRHESLHRPAAGSVTLAVLTVSHMTTFGQALEPNG